jgi:hypothetical protein
MRGRQKPDRQKYAKCHAFQDVPDFFQ